jgi:hypothetical protein
MSTTFTIPSLPGENFLGIKATAERAGCSPQAIYDFIDNGKLPAIKIAGRLLYQPPEKIPLCRSFPRAVGITCRNVCMQRQDTACRTK